MNDREPTSPEFINTPPDSIEQYSTEYGYHEGKLFTEKGKEVDISEVFKPGEVALIKEKKEGEEQPVVYVLLKGVAISVQDSLKQENGGIIFKELDPVEDSHIAIGGELQFGQGGTVDRVLLSSTANHSGEPSDPQENPIAYFAKALIEHRREGRGTEEEDHRTRSGRAILALQLYK